LVSDKEGIMWRAVVAIVLGVALAGAVLAHAVFAQHPPVSGSGPLQSHDSMAGDGADMHAQHMRAMQGMTGSTPTMPGQDAFGAIAEIVRILDADPTTDWSKVDLEQLRQHLIDMNEVMLRSVVKQTPVSAGLAIEITGSGRTEQAIRAMVVPHAAELDRMPSFSASTATIPGGVRLTVVGKNPDDAKLVARIRGLGFAGLITEGAHHQPHHLAMAKGGALTGHTH
jgi:hypothetical protein